LKLTNIFYKTILIIFFFCLGLAITSFIWTAINSDIYIDLSNKGFLDFYNNYQAVVVLLGVGITLLTLLATFGRINQTDKQLQFSNFYTHREEFIKIFSVNRFIRELSLANDLETRILLNELHAYLFSRSYNDFFPKINKTAYSDLMHFYNKVKNSKLNRSHMALSQFTHDQILKERKSIPLPILRHIEIFSQKMREKLFLETTTTTHDLTEFEMKRLETVKSFQFIMLHDLVYTIKLIILLFGFDGITLEPLFSLDENIRIYRSQLKLPIDF